MKTDYTKQGEDFLRDTNTTLRVVECVPQKRPLWAKGDKHGINYSVTLKNERGVYVFDFWGSIAEKEILEAVRNFQVFEGMKTSRDFHNDEIIKRAGISLSGLRYSKTGRAEVLELRKPKAYDILACLDTYASNDFADFCANYGYNEDSRIAEKTFHAVQEQQNNLRKLFTHEELARLNEIN